MSDPATSKPFRIRVRGPEGTKTITAAPDSTWQDLLKEISAATSVPDFDLKLGYPPQSFDTSSIGPSTELSSLPPRSPILTEQLTVIPRALQPKLTQPLPPAPSSIQAPRPLPPNQPLLSSPSNPDDPPEIPLPLFPEESHLLLRVMPDDNSCLFRAVSSAVLGPSLDGMTELRSLVASTIRSDPEKFSEAILGRPPPEYCEWIQRENSWGGGIELAILSENFGVEIASVDVQRGRVDRFNEIGGENGEGRGKRVVLVYSGIHYDVCAVSPFKGAGPELDQMQFDVVAGGGKEGEEEEDFDMGVLDAARELCRGLRDRHYYTDTKGFELKCNVCGARGKGEEWAGRHAKETGHGDFGEGE